MNAKKPTPRFLISSIIIISAIILSVLIITSCYARQKQPSSALANLSGKENESDNESTPIVISENPKENSEENPQENPQTEDNTTLAESNTTAEEPASSQPHFRINEVDFYFLVKGKAYFRYTLKEEELKAFNISGIIVRVEPLLIARGSVKFLVDNITTPALPLKEWYAEQNFEIYVNEIYYRG